jgi:hypothetical protein
VYEREGKVLIVVAAIAQQPLHHAQIEMEPIFLFQPPSTFHGVLDHGALRDSDPRFWATLKLTIR